MKGLFIRCNKCQALLNNDTSNKTFKCPVCENEIIIDSSMVEDNSYQIGENNEISIIGDDIDKMISDFSEATLDDMLSVAMEKEYADHFNKISADVVALETANLFETVRYGELIWQVIEIENGKKLLLSKECMVMDFDWICKDDSYDDFDDFNGTLGEFCNNSKIDYTHEAEEIRKYFNEWFCEKYFSSAEIDRIEPHCIKIYKPDGSLAQEINERVFLLSEAEVQKYLPNCKDRIAITHVLFNDVPLEWLLRSDDEVITSQCVVNADGEIEQIPDGYLTDRFRPAIWVK